LVTRPPLATTSGQRCGAPARRGGLPRRGLRRGRAADPEGRRSERPSLRRARSTAPRPSCGEGLERSATYS